MLDFRGSTRTRIYILTSAADRKGKHLENLNLGILYLSGGNLFLFMNKCVNKDVQHHALTVKDGKNHLLSSLHKKVAGSSLGKPVHPINCLRSSYLAKSSQLV